MIKLLTDLWRECTICAVSSESPQIKEEHELEEHIIFINQLNMFKKVKTNHSILSSVPTQK